MSGLTNTQLTIKRGDTTNYNLSFRDEDGNVIDITGWTIFFTVKADIDDVDDDAVIKKTITEHTNPANGETKIILTSDETNLAIQGYVFDIQTKNASNEIQTIIEGTLTVTKDVTQRTS
jgi:hypothetical protein